MDNRKYTRLAIDVVVELRFGDGGHLYGETADISLDGAFVELTPPDSIRAGDDCRLDLIIKTEEGWVRVAFTSTVAHIRPGGIGLRFDAAHAAHHESFLRLLIEGAPDIDCLLEELSRHPGEGFRFDGT